MKQLLCLLVMVLLCGCTKGPKYEYWVLCDTPDGGVVRFETPANPTNFIEDGYFRCEYGCYPLENVQWKKIQVGPHQCECGNILSHYKDRCSQCGAMILMGRPNPPRQ